MPGPNTTTGQNTTAPPDTWVDPVEFGYPNPTRCEYRPNEWVTLELTRTPGDPHVATVYCPGCAQTWETTK